MAALAGLFLLLLVGALIQSPVPTTSYPSDPWGVSATYGVTHLLDTAFFATVVVVLGLIVGIGLWGMKSWAYPIAVGVYWLALLFKINSTWSSPLTGSDLVIVLISIAILVYLHQPKVRELFREQPSMPAGAANAQAKPEGREHTGVVAPHVGRVRRVKRNWSS